MPRSEVSRLVFKPIRLSDINAIRPYIQMADSRTCDYTLGGIFMWIDYFHYEYCILDDTLFLKGYSETDSSAVAFSFPIGAMPISRSVALLEEYCRRNLIPLRFSAIPEDKIDAFMQLRHWDVRELTDWADYVYDAQSLATLAGKKLNKKRNHVNRFFADNPGATLTPLTITDVPLLKEAYSQWVASTEAPDSDTAIEESQQTFSVLDHLDEYGFEGAVLRDASGAIVAFCLGEKIGDTLFTHIEKMNHTVAGAGETVNKMFAEMMVQRYADLRYINREEDVGDEGLRRAKQSYHPAMLLRKFDLLAV